MTEDQPTSQSLLSVAYRVRDLVNDSRPGGQPVWLHDRFASMCAAMDVIEDADAALKEYVTRPPGPIGYLELYGVFQALILQQDGVRELMAALQVDGYPSGDARLQEPRDLRNDATGHPSRRDRGPVVATQVARGSMNRDGFSLLRHPRVGSGASVEDVATVALLAAQQECLTAVLLDVAGTLESREREHREMHRDEKLAELFPPSVHYALQKVNEAARRRDDEPEIRIGLIHLTHLEGCVSSFEAALANRGITEASHPFVYLSLHQARDAINSLHVRLPAAAETATDADAVVVLIGLACLVRVELDDLIDIARELDENYASDDVAGQGSVPGPA